MQLLEGAEIGAYMKTISRDHPYLMQFSPQVVEGEHEGLGPGPHHEHDDECEGPDDEQEWANGEWDRREAPEDKSAVNRVEHIHYMCQEYEIWNLVILSYIQSRGGK